MNGFGRLPTGQLQSLVSAQTQPVTVTPPSASDPSYGEPATTPNEATQVPLVLYEPAQQPSYVPDGVVVNGDVQGLCLIEDTPALNARIDYADTRYELVNVREVPRTGTGVVSVLTFQPIAAET